MKYYNYSVKELLTDFYGDDPIFAMRKPHDSVHKSEEDLKNLLPLEWQYADEKVLHLFVDSAFLTDTVLFDDYIAYIGQFKDEKIVYLMFMLTEDDPFFHIDIEYAEALLHEWSLKGYKASILRECIDVDYYGNDHSNGFHFGTHSSPGRGHALHEIKAVNGKDILVFSQHSCWESYYRKIKSVSHSSKTAEYECLFEPDVTISSGEEKEKVTLSTGIDSVKAFFESNSPVKLAYKEFKNTDSYSQILVAGDKVLDLYVDRLNLISEINLSDISCGDRIIVDQSENECISLIDQIPNIVSIRALDPVQMHSLALQINYGGDNKRNYYLACFDGRTVPGIVEVDGHKFSTNVLHSVCLDSAGNVHFSNGYVIPKHILYYRSFRQVQPTYTGTVICNKNNIKIKSVYKLPLTEFKGHFSVRQYWGNPDECFGPKKAWLDSKGRRISDITLSTIESNDEYDNEATLVSVEPTFKYGFIKNDGTWLVPPIYDKSEKFYDGCAKVTRNVDGTEKTFLLTKEGIEKPFDFPVDVEAFTNNRCAFNAEKWTGEWPDSGYYWDYDWVTPGKWGFIDSEGKVIVEPKYVFAAGFYNGGGDHSVVARFVDDKLCWGVIDLYGNEVIPCKYPCLYCRWGEAVAFQCEENGPYGVMDFDGNVIVEPQFDYIEAYDPKHKLVTAGDDSDHVGVYSVELKKMLIPPEYDCVDYNDRMISCELSWTCKDRYFDYSGNELDFSEYDSVYEKGELLGVWKDGKNGLIDWDKNIIIPPIMKNGFSYDDACYKKGFVISEREKLQGLTKLPDQVIIPEIYSDLSPHGELIIASQNASGNWCLKDSLFTIDGELIMSGVLKNMRFDSKSKTMSVETPTGVEFFEIETNN